MAQAKCSACARVQPAQLVCAYCGAPLAAELDYFAAFGLPRRLTLDPSELQPLYYDLGRRLHPDRFVNQPVALRAASLKGTALLTRAFRTLRDPVARGLYWLELNDEKLSSDNKQPPAELVELIFDVQESLSDLRSAEGAERTRLASEVGRRREELGAAVGEAMAELRDNFERWDKQAADRDILIRELKRILSRIAYLRSVLRDVERELEAG